MSKSDPREDLQVLKMPGKSFRGALAPLSETERVLAEELRETVETLAVRIGERNFVHKAELDAAATFLETSLAKCGRRVDKQNYQADGQTYCNLAMEVEGREKREEIVVVGGHYDSVLGTKGANDNGTGAAAVLALARRFCGRTPARTVRFVEFVNEEPPFFWSENMGSIVYAKRCKARGERLVGMLALETIGYYSDEKGSQKYPFPFHFFFPSEGNFIAFVANLASGSFLRRVVSLFRTHTSFPSQGCAAPPFIPYVGASDHGSFWKMGYPAVMVTDTAPYRYPYYHTSQDTADKIDFERTARVVAGLEHVVAALAGDQ